MSQRISSSSAAPNRDLTEIGRRERELNSLYATARSLTALGELDDVLASIVKYAHELIGSDLTYLSVFDTDGNLTLRASEGAFSSGFRNARVPANTGVAARVVESAAPYWVSDYLSHDDLIHDAEFDKVVADEGLKALLGVPLRASGAVIGICTPPTATSDRSVPRRLRCSAPSPTTPSKVAAIAAALDRPLATVEETEAMFKLAPAGE